MDEVLKIIKTQVERVLPGSKVFLFGSRTRQGYRFDSDYDILVVSELDLNISEKRNFETQIHKAVVKFEILADIIVQSENEISINKHLPGHVVKHAMEEAIPI